MSEDAVMEEAPRKIISVKKRKVEEKLYDEDGQEIEFEGDVIEEEAIEEDVVQRDEDDWEDDSEDEEEEEDGAGKKKEVWDPSKAPL